MRINIEIDVAPDEIALATELLAVLRSITDHVGAKQPTLLVNGQANGLPTGHVVPSLQQAPSVASTVSQQRPGPVAAEPSAVPSTPSQAPVASAAGGLMPPPMKASLPDMLRQLSAEAKYAQSMGQVLAPDASAAAQAIVAHVLQNADKLDEFVAAFEHAVFVEQFQPQDPNHAPVVPFFHMLLLLPEDLKATIKKQLIPKVLRQLTMRRPITVDRSEFILWTEGFAALAQIEFFGIDGALKTITTLVQKEETRAAAMTMLGKTIELCHDQIVSCDKPEVLQNLQQAVAESVKELDLFAYDMQYICQMLNWPWNDPTPTANYGSVY